MWPPSNNHFWVKINLFFFVMYKRIVQSKKSWILIFNMTRIIFFNECLQLCFVCFLHHLFLFVVILIHPITPKKGQKICNKSLIYVIFNTFNQLMLSTEFGTGSFMYVLDHNIPLVSINLARLLHLDRFE